MSSLYDNNNRIDIKISEVGPRDGLQNITQIMDTFSKKKWITALAQCGLPEIEVGSFVSQRLLPQLADTAEIVSYARTINNLNIAVLVPNFRGAVDAVNSKVHKISIPISVSETHSIMNVQRTHKQMLEEIKKIRTLLNSLPNDQKPVFEGSLSTCFGCTLEGHIADKKVLQLAELIIESGCDEVGLSDTTGFGNPRQVTRLTKKIWSALGKKSLSSIHLHNTRGQGLANALAAVDVGLTTIDASLGGIGGCPFVPGASGNIVTEDLVFLLESMGVKTGVNFDKLMTARSIFHEALPDVELYGFTPNAGFTIN